MTDYQNKFIYCAGYVVLIVSGVHHRFDTKEQAFAYIGSIGLKPADFECISNLHPRTA
jgi:hypothetical protein